MNICFASQKRGIKIATLNSINGFYEIFAPPPKDIDILVLNGDCDMSPFVDQNIDTCIFDSKNALKVLELKKVNSAVSCGMEGLDSVTFSSISEDTALVCIRRPIVFKGKAYEPCEFKASFNTKCGIYQNLAVSLVEYLVTN